MILAILPGQLRKLNALSNCGMADCSIARAENFLLSSTVQHCICGEVSLSMSGFGLPCLMLSAYLTK